MIKTSKSFFPFSLKPCLAFTSLSKSTIRSIIFIFKSFLSSKWKYNGRIVPLSPISRNSNSTHTRTLHLSAKGKIFHMWFHYLRLIFGICTLSRFPFHLLPKLSDFLFAQFSTIYSHHCTLSKYLLYIYLSFLPPHSIKAKTKSYLCLCFTLWLNQWLFRLSRSSCTLSIHYL